MEISARQLLSCGHKSNSSSALCLTGEERTSKFILAITDAGEGHGICIVLKVKGPPCFIIQAQHPPGPLE